MEKVGLGMGLRFK